MDEPMLTITFNHLPLGIRPNANYHYHIRSKKAQEAAAATYERLPEPPDIPLDGVDVAYIFYLPDLRHRDPDNLVFSCKPHLDAIVRSGWLRDDRWPCVRRIFTCCLYRPKEPGFTIQLERSTEC